jgi:hypothetical protein
MRSFTLPAMLAAAALAVGCAGGGYYSEVGYSSPDLVYVSPGVSVVADYDEPVFYSDNYYWRYNNNNWYRSNYYDRGWSYARPPIAVGRIQSPYAYRHYRGPDAQVVRRGYYGGYNRQPVRRDYRGGIYRNDGYRGGTYRNDGYRGDRSRGNRTVIRDHRR